MSDDVTRNEEGRDFEMSVYPWNNTETQEQDGTTSKVFQGENIITSGQNDPATDNDSLQNAIRKLTTAVKVLAILTFASGAISVWCLVTVRHSTLWSGYYRNGMSCYLPEYTENTIQQIKRSVISIPTILDVVVDGFRDSRGAQRSLEDMLLSVTNNVNFLYNQHLTMQNASTPISGFPIQNHLEIFRNLSFAIALAKSSLTVPLLKYGTALKNLSNLATDMQSFLWQSKRKHEEELRNISVTINEILVSSVQSHRLQEETWQSAFRSIKDSANSERNMSTASTGDVRLVNGNQYAGRVEVRYGSEWGTICDDTWDINGARVICRMLGFSGATSALSSSQFGGGSGEILLKEIS